MIPSWQEATLKTTRTQFIAALGLLAVVLFSGCKASNAASADRAGIVPFYKWDNGLAIRGYDPVAYFSQGKPVEGHDEFEAEWSGAKWRFASAEDRESFLGSPESYAPQYGGYCAWAVGHGYTAKGDPGVWKIVAGKLYLNYNQEVKAKWEQDIPALVSKGDQNWQSFLTTKPEHKGEGSN
jgi:hypothetical protein